jgi:hypothetical protein
MTLLQLVFYAGLPLCILIFWIGNKMSNESNYIKKSVFKSIGLMGLILYAVLIVVYIIEQVNWNYKVF